MKMLVKPAMAFAVTATMLLAAQTLFPSLAFADSPAETLEKGIYSEETTGDLKQAIEHYRQVLSDAKKTQSLAAQAQYRLGRCLNKLGKKNEAEAAFETLLKNYPDQKDLIAKARKMMPSRPEMLAAPWKSGERLTLLMMLGNDKPIGVIGTAVSESTRDGKAVWEMNIRRHVGDTNSGVSTVIVDKSTNLPLSTVWDHTILGKAIAQWESDKLVITKTTKEGESDTKTVEFDAPAYSNDQWFFGFRQLPMKVGNKITVPLRIAFTGGNGVDMEIEVAAKEKVETPVGTFDCFRLDTNISQTFWITDTPERYIAQFEGGGVRAVLTSIGDDQPVALSNDKLGLSVTVPGGWFHYQRKTGNDTTSGGFNLVAPESIVSGVVKIRKKSMLDSDERKSLKDWLDSIIREAKDFSKGAAERAESRKEVEFAGQPGVTMVFDTEISGRPLTASPTVAFKGNQAVEVGFSGDAAQFGKYRETFDAIRSSVTVK